MNAIQSPSSPATGPTLNDKAASLVAVSCVVGLAGFALAALLSAVLSPSAVTVNVDGEQCVTRQECEASGDEVASDIAPLVGPGYVDSFALTCLRTATLIQAPCGQVSYEAQVPTGATASVVFGDSAITASGGGIVRAAGGINGGNVRYEYCRTTLDAGVSINVRALCSSAP
jgi:hypothetical protein